MSEEIIEKSESESGNWTFRKAKRITAIGAAILVSGSLVAGAWTFTTKTYAFAQRVEVYVKLPEWLGRVEAKMDESIENQNKIAEEVAETRKLVRRLYRKANGGALPEESTEETPQ